MSSIVAHQVPSIIDRFVHVLRLLIQRSAGQAAVRRDARRLADAMSIPGA